MNLGRNRKAIEAVHIISVSRVFVESVSDAALLGALAHELAHTVVSHEEFIRRVNLISPVDRLAIEVKADIIAAGWVGTEPVIDAVIAICHLMQKYALAMYAEHFKMHPDKRELYLAREQDMLEQRLRALREFKARSGS